MSAYFFEGEMFMRGVMPPEVVKMPTEKLHGDIPLEFILRKAANETWPRKAQDEAYLWAVSQSVQLINPMDRNGLSMRSARKEHTCQKCQRTIVPDESYVRYKFDADGYESVPYCIPCAAQYLIDFYKVYLYAPDGGFTHWSAETDGPIRCKDENNRSIPLWKPAEIPPEIRARLKQSGDLLRQEMSDISAFDPEKYHPLTDSLLAAANGDDTIEAYFALKEAVSISRDYDRTYRWRLIDVGDLPAGSCCFGCGENLSIPSKILRSRPAFYICGEKTDYLCPQCAAKVILTIFIDRVLDWQVAHPHFFGTEDESICLFDDLREKLFGEYKAKMRREYYQAKIDKGASIEDIAEEEKVTVSAVRQRLNNLGVALPDRRKNRKSRMA